MTRGSLVFGLLVLAVALWLHRPDADWDGDSGALQSYTTEQVRAGEYLVRAGDCIACHTAQGGAAYAGSRPIETPFGTFFSTNLTPDAETGIGSWTQQDFWNALHHGRSKGGRRLYPAFPYPNYTLVTREDADAMFAYLRTLEPVHAPAREAAVRFPYSTGLALRIWRALYFRPGTFTPEPQRTAQWNRGAYLVEGLGHCSACHGERTWLGAIERSRGYVGGPIPMLGWDALPLTFDPPLDDAQAEQMVELLKAGTSRDNVASGPMAEVVFRSLQYLRREDLRAMVEYLRSLPPQPPRRARTLRVSASEARAMMERGAEVYRAQCADCHGAQGEGAPYKYPPLVGNRLVTAPSPSNAIEVVLYGGYGPSTRRVPRPYGMPPYAHTLSRREVAAVLTYVRGSWGNQAPAVSVKAVERH